MNATVTEFRIDWFRLIVTLRGCGMSEREIARRLGVDHSNVVRWKQGVEPVHEKGERLIRLYCSQLALTRDDVPVRPAIR